MFSELLCNSQWALNSQHCHPKRAVYFYWSVFVGFKMGQVLGLPHSCGLKFSNDQTSSLTRISDNVLSSLVFPVLRDITFSSTKYLNMKVRDQIIIRSSLLRIQICKAFHCWREAVWRWQSSLYVLLLWCCSLHWLKAVSFIFFLFFK